MVDELNSVGPGRPQKTKQTDASIGGGSVENNASRAEKTTAPSPSVEVELSEGVQRSEERAQFDEAKVRELKDQIEKGNYPLDSQKIAEKFADLEQLL